MAKYFANSNNNNKIKNATGGGGGKKNPLHSIINFHKDMNAFRTVFDLTMQHFPLRIGWMFRKDLYGETPFQKASAKYGVDNVRAILDEALNNQTGNDGNFILKSYVIAATEESVDVECDYILLSRDPSILKPMPQLQSQEQQEATTSTTKKTYWISGAVLRHGKKRKRNNATTFFDNLYVKSFLRGRKRQKKDTLGVDDDKFIVENANKMDWYEVEF